MEEKIEFIFRDGVLEVSNVHAKTANILFVAAYLQRYVTSKIDAVLLQQEGNDHDKVGKE